ncbi:MAG: hypothetical protein P1Q69_16295, partial [Candidatus Thorarchaeota archaeon]|nr:hypothetical protein [Candidatus Thorarchaeota archaeon]
MVILKAVILGDTECGKISLWDFGGQQRFIDSLKGMIRGAQVGLLLFDVSRLQTLDNLENYWIPAIKE